MAARGAHLAEMANLGPRSAAMLLAAGITSFARLKRMGAVAAYARVKAAGQPASLNLLWALEGALTGTHWRVIARDDRTRLLIELDDYLGQRARR